MECFEERKWSDQCTADAHHDVPERNALTKPVGITVCVAQLTLGISGTALHDASLVWPTYVANRMPERTVIDGAATVHAKASD